MCSFARAAVVHTDFTACYTQEAQERYTQLVEFQYQDRDTARASLDGQCVYDEMKAETGKPVAFYVRGSTCFRVIEMTVHWSKREGVLDPPRQMYATSFFRCEAESA
jgi:hypothetical protein